MSLAFDTLCWANLLTVLENDLIELIRSLFVNLTLSFTSAKEAIIIKTTLGTQQVDSLSPLLFSIYLEGTLKVLLTNLPNNKKLTRELIYADYVILIVDPQEEAYNYIPITSKS